MVMYVCEPQANMYYPGDSHQNIYKESRKIRWLWEVKLELIRIYWYNCIEMSKDYK